MANIDKKELREMRKQMFAEMEQKQYYGHPGDFWEWYVERLKQVKVQFCMK